MLEQTQWDTLACRLPRKFFRVKSLPALEYGMLMEPETTLRDRLDARPALSRARRKKLCIGVHRAVDIDLTNDLACHLDAEIFPRGNEPQGKVGGIMDEERNLWREYERYKQELLTMDIDPQTFAALCRAKAKELGL